MEVPQETEKQKYHYNPAIQLLGIYPKKTKILIFFFFFFKAAPVAYGVSHARGPTGAIAAGLGHSNAKSEPPLRPKPQLMKTLDP